MKLLTGLSLLLDHSKTGEKTPMTFVNLLGYHDLAFYYVFVSF